MTDNLSKLIIHDLTTIDAKKVHMLCQTTRDHQFENLIPKPNLKLKCKIKKSKRKRDAMDEDEDEEQTPPNVVVIEISSGNIDGESTMDEVRSLLHLDGQEQDTSNYIWFLAKSSVPGFRLPNSQKFNEY
jgi:hypothetical protein